MAAADLSFLFYPEAVRERPLETGSAPAELAGNEAERLFVTYLFPELGEWLPLLKRAGVAMTEAATAAAACRRSGTDLVSELLATGAAEEAAIYRALAAEIGVVFVPHIDPARLVVRHADAVAMLSAQSRSVPVKLMEKDGGTAMVIAPRQFSPSRLKSLIEQRGTVRQRLRLTTPGALRQALIERTRAGLVRSATTGLFDEHPPLSARIVANAWQGSLLGALAVGLPVAMTLAPGATWFGLHIFFSLFFLSCVGLRFAAIRSALPRQRRPKVAVDPRHLPTFSVLVALHREASVVPELVAALTRLDWPKARLEIKLVCEEDDRDTLDALARLSLPAFIEVVRVPVFGPRTKPKALAFALPLTGGEFVALYDAEDHPHPQQLLEAWQAFEAGGRRLACVQAPLEISNRTAGPVARMFAFEYAALFRGLLPWLAARRMMVPLGGTSNHFRRSALTAVGGWDPHNVTEDADLGLRLARFGYLTGTISRPTFEAAPDTVRNWVPQRTRWFKGFLQTWLVHMRNPARLLRELGPGSFIVAQILFAGMVISALAHPLLIATGVALSVELMLDRPLGTWKSILFAVDIVNIACGYLSFLLLGWQTLERSERRGFWRIVAWTPAYWMLMSWAAWRAVWQLWRKPHLWEKTPHQPVGAPMGRTRPAR